jgi:hypothetical protein
VKRREGGRDMEEECESEKQRTYWNFTLATSFVVDT